MQLFSHLFNSTRFLKLTRHSLLFVSFLLSAFAAHSQSPQYSFAPADSQFVMQLSRIKNEVVIALDFNDSLIFEYVAIERRPNFSEEFSQCKYITYDEIKTKGRHIVKKDVYPYPASSDVLYRIKLATAEGVIRTYPPVTLPAVSK